MSLLQALFGTSVTVIGEDGQPQPQSETETGGLVERFRAMFDFVGNWQYPPFDCQNCGRPMRGPICAHCGETQAGYDYSH